MERARNIGDSRASHPATPAARRGIAVGEWLLRVARGVLTPGAPDVRPEAALDDVTLRQYQTLSPFEIKDFLATIATGTARATQAAYLNAGRGNPNWIATEPRSAFFLLGQFAVTESQRVMDLPEGLGGMPKAAGIAARLDAWLAGRADTPGAALLRTVVPWAIATFSFQPDAFVHELVDAIIGDNYPVPDRMLVHNEQIVQEYLQWAMCGEPRPAGTFDLFAVEGGTAAMCYIFKSLKANRLLNRGRHHRARHADLHAVSRDAASRGLRSATMSTSRRAQDDSAGSSPTRIEAARGSEDQGVLHRQSRQSPRGRYRPGIHRRDRSSARTKRPDLMLLTDDVYGTFVPGFRSLLARFAANTIGVYSYSKYFGCTGWRLGVIAVHEHNIFDEMIADAPRATRRRSTNATAR